MPETDQRPHEDPGPARAAKRADPAEGRRNRSKPEDVGSEGDMRHRVAGSIVVEEESGIAAAEATGKIRTDNDEDPEETAGSG